MDTITKVNINVVPDTATVNQVNMVVNVDKGEKIKIAEIDFIGNELSDKTLRARKDTKQKNSFVY
jgi:outer membrane protein insertion porin family